MTTTATAKANPLLNTILDSELLSSLTEGCYLLHLDRKLGQPQDQISRAVHGLQPRDGSYEPHAGHYLGYAEDVKRRIVEHMLGRGAKFTRRALEEGIGFTLVRVWPGADRSKERQLKNQKNSPRLCPICNGSHSEDA